MTPAAEDGVVMALGVEGVRVGMWTNPVHHTGRTDGAFSAYAHLAHAHLVAAAELVGRIIAAAMEPASHRVA